MVHDSTIRFITGVKLGEIRAQRGQLRREYDQIFARAVAGTDPSERPSTLYTGL